MQKTLPRISAAVFDMDGTLLDTEWIGHQSWVHAGGDCGVEVPLEVVNQMVGRTLPAIQALIRDAFPSDLAEQLMDRANFHYHRMVEAEPPALKAGAKEILDFLHSRGVPCALATSSRTDQLESKLGRTGLRDYFDFVIAGDQVQDGKPHPEIFERAAAGLGKDVGDCVAFEDSGPGVRSAKAAGMLTIFIPEHEEHPEEVVGLADLVLPDLHAAIAVLDGMLG